MSRGVLYIVTKEKSILNECIFSAGTLRKYSPDLSTCIITDLELSSRERRNFNSVVQVKDIIHPLKAKVKFLAASPFSQTLFIDADTKILDNLSPLFGELETSDFAFTFDNFCDWTKTPPLFLSQESKDINTGFLLFNKNAASQSIFEFWFDKIKHQDENAMRPGTNCDQVYFNNYVFQEIKNRGINHKVLSNEIYNVRPWCWHSLKERGKWNEIKLLHAHHLDRNFISKLKAKLSRN
jgi:hypothetical protein